ncbi:MAG: 30S ribosomal protein S6 [Actinomycetota bacterium]
MSPSREYELVLMLDPDITDERREQIAAEARTRIESGGSLKQDTSWGTRKLAYEIEQRTEADYRFFRFETDGGLLDDLNHNLRIADGVLRFRIFKVDPRSPAIVPSAPQSAVGAPPARGGRRPQGAAGREEAPAAAESTPGDEPTPGEEPTEAPQPAAEEAPASPQPAAEEAPAAAQPAAEEAPVAPSGEEAAPAAEEAEPAADAAEEEPAQAGEQDPEREDS